MKKAVIITAHKITNNLKLFKQIMPETDFYLHVDKKSDIEDFSDIKDYFYFVERVNVSWGHFSQIEATVILLKAVVNKGYDYISFISGDDLPIMTEANIDLFLEANKGKEFIGLDIKKRYDCRCKYNYTISHTKRVGELSFPDLITKAFHLLTRKLLFKNKLYKNLPELYKGTNWFTITNECAYYFVNYIGEHPSYVEAFKKSICGDELFFHTIFFNSYLKERQYRSAFSSSARYIDWDNGPEYPRILDDTDLEKIVGTNTIFGRKFSNKHSEDKYRRLLEVNRPRV